MTDKLRNLIPFRPDWIILVLVLCMPICIASGRGEFISITDDEAMTAGLMVSQLEGIIPAIETSHAFAIFDHRSFNPDDIVVINLSGRGDKDLQTYIDYFKL